jgi:hypothetical protein
MADRASVEEYQRGGSVEHDFCLKGEPANYVLHRRCSPDPCGNTFHALQHASAKASTRSSGAPSRHTSYCVSPAVVTFARTCLSSARVAQLRRLSPLSCCQMPRSSRTPFCDRSIAAMHVVAFRRRLAVRDDDKLQVLGMAEDPLHGVPG